MTDEKFNRILEQLTLDVGIVPRDSHKDGIRRFCEKREQELSQNRENFDYEIFLKNNPQEIKSLIDGATVNETYFFREEKQFKFLREKLFPVYRITSGGPVKIWSAACSSGEEAYSLALLAQSCFLHTEITASDINTERLATCRKGLYGKNSVRTVDGASYRHLLSPYEIENKNFLFPQSVKSLVKTEYLNLAQLAEDSKELPPNLPRGQHIIFVRNVFIYFTRETRAGILRTMTEKCLVKGGCIFVSMNEMASIDASLVPRGLKKCVDGQVFYFKKEV